MRKIRKWIIILAIIIAILLILLILLKKLKNKEIMEYDGDLEIEKNIEELKIVDARNKYYIVKNIVEYYYDSLCNLNLEEKDMFFGTNNGYSQTEKEQMMEDKIQFNKEKIYSFFDDNYKKQEGLTIDNIKEILGSYKNIFINISDIKYIEKSDENMNNLNDVFYLTAYLVNGQICNKNSNEINDFSLMIMIDSQNLTFNIYTEEYMNKNKYINFSKKNWEDFNFTTIQNRGYNTYEYKLISDEEYINDLFLHYINNVKYNTKNSYELLDDEYREKKFHSYDDYLEYVKRNFTNNYLNKYKKSKEGTYTKYVFIDTNNCYYIFKESSPFQYKVLLDTYTVELTEVEDKYVDSEEPQRVALNIQKVFDALNDKDYNYVYSKLSDGFKSNNFKTLEDFEKYAKDKFFGKNEVEYLYYKKESEEYYSYTIKVKNANNKTEEVTLKIIMKLQNGTNFLMSFNV